MALISYKLGQGSIVLRVKILNSSVATGAGLTGLTYQSTGLIVSTIADNEASATVYTVAAGNVETIATLGTFAAPTAGKCRLKEVDAANHKGVYEIQIADARFNVANAKSLLVSVSGATNAAETDVVIPLTRLDPYDVTQLADAMLDRADAIEADMTLRQALRIGAAVLAGKVTGAGTGAETFKGLDGLTTRVVVATDNVGNRLNVTYTPN